MTFMLATEHLNKITGHSRYEPSKQAFVDRINGNNGKARQLRRPHILAQTLAQTLHECGGFKYTREIWGPTPAQRRYEGRKDLGNVYPGDGKRFSGRDFIQTTGRDNYRALTVWVRANVDPAGPDFEAHPELLTSPEWLDISVIWYFSVRVSMRYLEAGDIEMITRRVNGGLNGYRDRLNRYNRAALVILGYGRTQVRTFQRDCKLTVDGISGPKTRAMMYHKLRRMV